ncbi:DNA-binding transcriptional regulator, MarR family [Chitinophaga jiangningensis]|uniref:DNA-binding transcriptional regulator, MarR family n=1 Tax=Chitinophaga jiangningensis TaxID=1419482 RepID=A0A1M6Y5Q8_9BACT|nr:winged helix DNA-binding protein [Chitinophaga jiangningensis]SHL13640.1 DNA-binding transcriptional regulator, MarR family [Chitinophaga jiangningensis]
MNKTVELVNHWGSFEEKHPNGSIADFCRYYLARQQQEPPASGKLVGGVVPPVKAGLLMKIIGRISKLNMSYANIALEGTGLHQIEEFGILLTIRQEQSPRKTEVIYANLFELSSGTDMLNRLQKRGLIKEYADKEDKRSKRIELTAKGEKVIKESKAKIEKNATMLLNTLTDDDKDLCIQLLKEIEIKLSEQWQRHKGKSFDEIYDELMPPHKG